jgi:hypothetical protein
MFRPQTGHLQVLQVSHTPLPNYNANISISINGPHKLVSVQLTNQTNPDWTLVKINKKIRIKLVHVILVYTTRGET